MSLLACGNGTLGNVASASFLCGSTTSGAGRRQRACATIAGKEGEKR